VKRFRVQFELVTSEAGFVKKIMHHGLAREEKNPAVRKRSTLRECTRLRYLQNVSARLGEPCYFAGPAISQLNSWKELISSRTWGGTTSCRTSSRLLCELAKFNVATKEMVVVRSRLPMQAG
jgi:hypothetical protein